MNEDFRKTAPQPLAPVPFNISPPFTTTLDNGLKIVVVEQTRLPLVSYRLAIRSGGANDANDSIGTSSALASMLSEGTRNYTSRELAEQIERLGATVSAAASADNTSIAASALSLYSSDVLRLMAEMILMPIVPEGELALYKQNAIENLKFQRAESAFLADEQINRIIYGSHPYRTTAPTPADIEKITREKLLAWREKTFVPNNATMIVVGDVRRDEILEEIKDAFGGWQRGEIEEFRFDAPPVRTEKTLTVVDRPGSAQSNIVLSNLGIERNNPDFFPIVVLNKILGEGGSARLFMNLREEKGYTYGAYSSFDSRRLAGAFEATAEVRTPVTGDSLKEFFYELNRIRDERVSEKELSDAKNYLTGVFPLRAETQEGLTNLIVAQELYNLPADYLETYRDKISAVTADDVGRVAQKYITPEKIAIVVVGDAEEILRQAKPYAEKIEVFDTDSKPIDVSTFGKEPSGEAANVGGIWNLTIDFQGQQLPVTLTLEQDGDGKIFGSLDSMLGKGDIADAKVSGSKFSGTARTEFQGQAVELNISGTIDEDSMKGNLTVPMPGVPPLSFTGTRTK